MTAIALHLFEKNGAPEDRQAALDHVEKALTAMRELVELADRSYICTTDISMGEIHNWHGALKRIEKDHKDITASLTTGK